MMLRDKPPGDPLIEMTGVQFHYPGRPTEWILRDASLVVREGERVGLTGDNGSGKTTVAATLAWTVWAAPR